MSRAKQAAKRQWLIAHRTQVYVDALNRLIDGNTDPAYVERRWEKLKQVRNKRRI